MTNYTYPESTPYRPAGQTKRSATGPRACTHHGRLSKPTVENGFPFSARSNQGSRLEVSFRDRDTGRPFVHFERRSFREGLSSFLLCLLEVRRPKQIRSSPPLVFIAGFLSQAIMQLHRCVEKKWYRTDEGHDGKSHADRQRSLPRWDVPVRARQNEPGGVGHRGGRYHR